MPATTKGSET